ncbi:hypothetical protein TSOC_011217 [Tetrabaena socialis]|uniref:RING-CH-type domain-containing protein n=1 Tax=Tetrabaena socialis TaxID=47790 RepID=A0A2J7ZR66_9CHLO|nr:hypothetical protein TSOC_011217 [Tetrabaena socialis]|eukprot:PNH02771.1 hypothetical protein TSOC_011217 [Tetrabaena socialis]
MRGHGGGQGGPDAAASRDQTSQNSRSKWSGGTEIACRGGPSGREEEPEASTSEVDVCWVCLDGASPDKPLQRPCKCPRFCHGQCIARKETHCEFCQAKLPEWKQALTPPCGSQAPRCFAAALQQAVMNVNFGGRTYSFEVQPGPDGYRRFTSAIRSAFSLPEDSELNITFTCDEPATGKQARARVGAGSVGSEGAGKEGRASRGSLLTLQGAGAYDAAVHCASVSAARRISTGTPLAPAPIWPVNGGGGGGGQGGAGGGGAAGGANNKGRGLGSLGRRLRNAVAELFGGGDGGSSSGAGGAAPAPAGGGGARN